MPKGAEANEPGPWVACALRTSTFGTRREIYSETVKGNALIAYCKARLLALRLDEETPYADGELGVAWAVRKLETA